MRNRVNKNNTALKYLLNKDRNIDLQKPGVYKLGFFGTKNFYIGSTTESFNLRFLRHFRDLKSKNHCNNVLQKAFAKYNKEIYLEILEVCVPEKCLSTEQYYIDTLKPKYNICKVAGNTFGVKPSKKSLQMHSKKVDMFDLDGNFLQTFNSRKEAYRQTGICDSCIIQAIANKGIASDFQFRNHGENTKLSKYENSLSCKLLVYNSEGFFVKQYSSMLEASIDLNIPVGNISKHLNGFTKICYGYIFKHYSDNFLQKIVEYKRLHKNQQKVKITNLKIQTEIVFNSLRSVDSSIISRSSIFARRKKEGDVFYIKDEYKVEIITCNINEITET
jgi:group I intron endonuclease